MGETTPVRLRRRKMTEKEKEGIAALHYEQVLLDCKAALGHSSKRMNDREYQRLKGEFANKRQARIDAAEADYKKEMEALELIRSASQGGETKHGISELTQSRIVITDLVMAVLPTLPPEFTAFDIEHAIAKKFPEAKGTFKKNSLSGTITRLKKRRIIDFVKRGSGPEGSTYKRVP